MILGYSHNISRPYKFSAYAPADLLPQFTEMQENNETVTASYKGEVSDWKIEVIGLGNPRIILHMIEVIK